MTNAWTNLVIPGTGTTTGRQEREKHFVYKLKHLNSESYYEVQLQAKNKYGWSERSNLVTFFTYTHLVKGWQKLYILKGFDF